MNTDVCIHSYSFCFSFNIKLIFPFVSRNALSTPERVKDFASCLRLSCRSYSLMPVSLRLFLSMESFSYSMTFVPFINFSNVLLFTDNQATRRCNNTITTEAPTQDQ